MRNMVQKSKFLQTDKQMNTKKSAADNKNAKPCFASRSFFQFH